MIAAVRVPPSAVLAALAGAASREREVRALWFGATHREERYAALDLMRRREHRGLWTPAALPLLEELVVTGAWWDLVDELATKLVRATLGNAPESAETLRRWSRGDDLWLRRAVIGLFRLTCQGGLWGVLSRLHEGLWGFFRLWCFHHRYWLSLLWKSRWKAQRSFRSSVGCGGLNTGEQVLKRVLLDLLRDQPVCIRHLGGLPICCAANV